VIAAIASLGDDPFKPHDTCLPEDDRAVRIRDVLRQAEFAELDHQPHVFDLEQPLFLVGDELCLSSPLAFDIS
jgi:hypothetical protein